MCVSGDFVCVLMMGLRVCSRQTIVQSMKKKHYSFLDQRRTDFDVDYEEFCQSTGELHVSEEKTNKSICFVRVLLQHYNYS